MISQTSTDNSYFYNTTSSLSSYLSGKGYTVNHVTSYPESYSSTYNLVIDTRVTDSTNTLSSTDVAYLAAGGKYLGLGENSSYNGGRNQILVDAISQLGGGTITLNSSYGTSTSAETINSSYTSGISSSTITYPASQVMSSVGNGSFITELSGEGGSAAIWKAGTLSNATAGEVILVMDGNFMSYAFDTNETGYNTTADYLQYLQNLIDTLLNGSTSSTSEVETVIASTSEDRARVVVRTVTRAVASRLATLVSSGGIFRPAKKATGAQAALNSIQHLASANLDVGRLETGLAGGGLTENLKNLALWGEVDGSIIDSELSSNKYSGNTVTLMVGGDASVSDDLVVGFVLNYERSDLDLATLVGTSEVDGLGLTLYAAKLLKPNLMADFQLGGAFNWNDISTASTGTTITGSYDSKRLMVAGNLTYFTSVDTATEDKGIDVTLSTGLTYSIENFDDYEDSTGAQTNPEQAILTQAHVTGEIAYPMEKMTPYLSVRLENDLDTGSNNSNKDTMGGLGTVGVRFNANDNLSGSGALSTQVGRQNEEMHSLQFNMRYQF
ncbi:putative Uncharacterized protein YaiT [Magnetofaba australis IT-1]|uniref:Autotransporter domain-containing protein n=1 Tax=Magnetofaba australis IT-1 TaxID=1434232 RepID=A0A1Y2K237_9PROT|nr:putative Uncharacterized protein YaiT [Magnetofaba australis IT-1]